MGVDNAAVARRYMQDVWAKGNLEVVDELVDDGIELKDPMTPHGVQGKDALRKRVREMSKAFSESDIRIEEVIVAGDRVVVRQIWRARHTGPFMRIAATNKYVSCLSSEVLRIRNGKVVEDISYFDQYEMYQQLGLLPSPDELVEQQQETLERGATATSVPRD